MNYRFERIYVAVNEDGLRHRCVKIITQSTRMILVGGSSSARRTMLELGNLDVDIVICDKSMYLDGISWYLKRTLNMNQKPTFKLLLCHDEKDDIKRMLTRDLGGLYQSSRYVYELSLPVSNRLFEKCINEICEQGRDEQAKDYTEFLYLEKEKLKSRATVEECHNNEYQIGEGGNCSNTEPGDTQSVDCCRSVFANFMEHKFPGSDESFVAENSTYTASDRMSTVDMLVTSELMKMGADVKLKGYDYLVDAISLQVLDDRRQRNSIMSIYESVGRIEGVSPAAAEKSIRTCINGIWNKGDTEYLKNFWGYGYVDNSNRPRAGQFIDYISFVIIHRMTCEWGMSWQK